MVEKNNKINRFSLAGYGRQVALVPLLAAALCGVFLWFFGWDIRLLEVNLVTLLLWGMLVGLIFWRQPEGKFWREYRWITASSVLILLFLLDVAWAESTLSNSSLEKRIIERTSFDIDLELYVEYPSQILYDADGKAEIHLWTSGPFHCFASKKLTVSSSNKLLLFAVKPPQDTPLNWRDNLSFDLEPGSSAVTLLVQPADPLNIHSQIDTLALKESDKPLQTDSWRNLKIEGRRDAQIRAWRKDFLATNGIIVSLIAAAFAAIKQLEDEKKRKRGDEIKHATDSLEADAKDDLFKALEKYHELIQDWNEWDKLLQDQFRDKMTDFIKSETFWESLSDLDISSLKGAGSKLLQLCERISLSTPEPLRSLNHALGEDVQALLNLIRDQPSSFPVGEKIAASLPADLKKKIIDEYKHQLFLMQIQKLKRALGFQDFDSFPLQRQFDFYAKEHLSESRLNAWLSKHNLSYSPFADAESPFYTLPNKQRLIEQAATGFTFSLPGSRHAVFEFSSAWDAGAALFEYCRNLQNEIQIKDEWFFVPLTPSIAQNYGAARPQRLMLHALAEAWLWLLAENATLFYSLKDPQRALLSRLLRWHAGSPHAVLHILEQRGAADLATRQAKIKEWLDVAEGSPLTSGEINILLELRPPPQKRTLLLVSAVDFNLQVTNQLPQQLLIRLNDMQDWLGLHGWASAHFTISSATPKTKSVDELARQCEQRLAVCSAAQVTAFDALFAPHAYDEPTDLILARKAAGSPGTMVRLGHRLLLQHVEKSSPDEPLHIEDLLALA